MPNSGLDLGALLPAALTAAAALAAVLAALWLAARGARAAGVGVRAGRRMAVQDVLALDARRRLTLVRCDGRDVLLLTGGGQDCVVGWMPPEAGPPA